MFNVDQLPQEMFCLVWLLSHCGTPHISLYSCKYISHQKLRTNMFYLQITVNEDSCDKDMFSDSEESEEEITVPTLQKPNKQKRKSTDPRISPFLDLTYWKK